MTVIVGINGSSWMASSGDDGIERVLRGLDGDRWHSLVLARLPVGADFRDWHPDHDMGEYIQCAGSADRLTIEIRERDGAELAQLVVGIPEDRSDSAPNKEVRWGDRVVYVNDNEVFDATSALPIFIEYAETGRLPKGLTVRKLIL